MSRSIAVRTLTRSTLIAVALLIATNTPLSAHGGGVIRLASPQVAVGGELAVTGEKLDKNASLRLEFRGILDNYPVGQVKTDAAGKFRLRIVLPPHVPAGVYTLVAVAADGDVAARTTVTVGGAASAAGSDSGAMPGMGGHGTQQMSGMHATAEMMVLQVSTSGGEWAVIAAFILLALGGGVALLRRAAATSHG